MATYLDLMFRDTIAGSMLRTLMLKRSMPQREFMRLYHVRCGRADAKTKSAFGHNFGRFVAREQVWNQYNYPSRDKRSAWQVYDGPLGCIAWFRPITGRDSSERMHRLEWEPPFVASILLEQADDQQVSAIENMLERIATSGSRLATLRAEPSAAEEALALLLDVRRYMRERKSSSERRASAAGSVRKLYDAVVANLQPVAFADWYWDSAELSKLARLRGKGLIAWKALRAMAESTDLTVGEYLHAYGILWTRDIKQEAA